jgi:hypothetical protein
MVRKTRAITDQLVVNLELVRDSSRMLKKRI